MPRWDRIIFRGYRVEHDGSMASYNEGQGILAASEERIPKNPRNWAERELLENALWDHLYWYNRTLTPFISTSTDGKWAFDQAGYRKEEGKTNVKVYQIYITASTLREYNVNPRNPRIHFKRVERWLDLARSSIPEYADYPSTENEYLFLHHIPEEFITRKWVI